MARTRHGGRWTGAKRVGTALLVGVLPSCGDDGRPGEMPGADAGARPLVTQARSLPDAAAPASAAEGGGLAAEGLVAEAGAAAPGDTGPGDAGTPAVRSCDPSALDEPDGAFDDTNCDGIDGDVERAVFVSNAGSDGAVGTRGAPVATLRRAVELSLAERKDVYVCNGKYAEALQIEAPVRLYGGYACERDWKRVPDRARVAPASGPALTVAVARGEVVIQSLFLEAASATRPGDSSVAVVVRDSETVAFSNVHLEAGNGGNGLPGSPVPDPRWSPPAPAADAVDVTLDGMCRAGDSCRAEDPSNPSGCRTVWPGASGQPRLCPGGEWVLGGPGGDGGNCGAGVDAEAGLPGIPALPSVTHDGRHGAAGSPFGRIEHGRYLASSDAQPGQPGIPGQAGVGGDGGASRLHGALFAEYVVGGGGGQGGYPGCGGAGGGAGASGGASIALLVIDSGVTLARSRVVTGRGGAGGAPSPGAPGQMGGRGGRGGRSAGASTVLRAQDGQAGSPGGHGGTGGPGAGGPSVGIAFTQRRPVVTDSEFMLGEAGAGAAGRTAAPDGIRAELHHATTPGRAQP